MGCVAQGWDQKFMVLNVLPSPYVLNTEPLLFFFLSAFSYCLLLGGSPNLTYFFFAFFFVGPQIILHVTTIWLLMGHTCFKGLKKGVKREGSWDRAMTSSHPLSDQATLYQVPVPVGDQGTVFA